MAKVTKQRGPKQDYRKGVDTEDKDIQKLKKRSGRTPKASDTKSNQYRDWISSEGKPTNDPAWYVNNPVLSRDVGSLWFSRPTGDPLVASSITDRSGTKYDIQDPGILAIPSVITWGGTMYQWEAQDSINLTAQKLYQYVVHANSRNISYDKKDLIMSMMSIDAVYCLITEAIRAYRLIANYDPQNKYVSNLLTALHWDKDNLAYNVARFRYAINWAITRVNKFFMPALFDIVKAHTSAYEHIYMDRPSMKGQMYVKYSPGVWLYDDTEGCLEYVKIIMDGVTAVDWSQLHTVDDFNFVISTMIGRIENSQYMGIMQGDLLKAFGFENMSNYAYVGIDMPILPVYDEEFLFKLHNADIGTNLSNFFIHNSNIAGMIYRDDDSVSGNIAAYAGRMQGSDMTQNYTWAVFRTANGCMVDLPAGIPSSPENIMLMNLHKIHPQQSRTGKWKLSDSGNTTLYWGKCPPEILFESTLYITSDMSWSTNVSTYTYGTLQIGYSSRFAHMPLLANWDDTAGATAQPIIWQTENVTFESYHDMERIIDVIFWSLWSNSTIANSDVATRETRV